MLKVYNIGDLDLTVPIRVAGPTVRLALGENEYGGTSVAVNAEISAYLTVGDAVRIVLACTYALVFSPSRVFRLLCTQC